MIFVYIIRLYSVVKIFLVYYTTQVFFLVYYTTQVLNASEKI